MRETDDKTNKKNINGVLDAQVDLETKTANVEPNDLSPPKKLKALLLVIAVTELRIINYENDTTISS